METKTKNTPKRGRPVKKKEKLNRSINLKLTEQDFDSVKEKAAKIGLTATQYAREMTLKGSIKSRFTLEELDLMRKLAGIANNLNQIAKQVNKVGFIRAAEDVVDIVNEVKKILDDC